MTKIEKYVYKDVVVTIYKCIIEGNVMGNVSIMLISDSILLLKKKIDKLI